MFYCRKRHDKAFEEDPKHDWHSHPGISDGHGVSLGPCEICGNVDECIDCHCWPEVPKKEK